VLTFKLTGEMFECSGWGGAAAIIKPGNVQIKHCY